MNEWMTSGCSQSDGEGFGAYTQTCRKIDQNENSIANCEHESFGSQFLLSYLKSPILLHVLPFLSLCLFHIVLVNSGEEKWCECFSHMFLCWTDTQISSSDERSDPRRNESLFRSVTLLFSNYLPFFEYNEHFSFFLCVFRRWYEWIVEWIFPRYNVL
jgi:hypothetical protein